MIETFFITLGVMLILVAAMAVGVMFGRKPLKGSCGGLNAVGLNGECKICGRTTGPCDSPDQQASSQDGELARKAAVLGKPVT
jgi:hypothetical protein